MAKTEKIPVDAYIALEDTVFQLDLWRMEHGHEFWNDDTVNRAKFSRKMFTLTRLRDKYQERYESVRM